MAAEASRGTHIPMGEVENHRDRRVAKTVRSGPELDLDAELAHDPIHRGRGQPPPFAGPVEVDEERPRLQPSLLVVDELGYLPMDQASANWTFQVVTRRYDRGSILLTSNRGFSDWGRVFSDAVLASAIVDRLLHNASVLNIRGRSYRMRTKRVLSAWLRDRIGADSSYEASPDSLPADSADRL
jgi:IstB-like ATP binding protein